MSNLSNRCLIALLALLLVPHGHVTAQQAGMSPADSSLAAAFESEVAGRRQESALAYRTAIQLGADTTQAIFGLERVYAELGWTDSLPPLLNALIQARPRDANLRGIQLRSLRMSGHPDRAREAFEEWVRLDASDGAPYRSYSRLLLDAGETAAADSILSRARAVLGGGGAVALELAQTRAAMGLWKASAESWRQAMERADYLSEAASFALAPTPESQRAAVVQVLEAPPVEIPARIALASLQLGWGNPADAWRSLSALPPNDSSATIWLGFADRAEAAASWPAARDALLAALAVKPTLLTASRAGSAALLSGNAEVALAATARVNPADEPQAWAQLVLPVRVRALAALGRAEEAAREVSAAGADSVTNALLQREVAYAWVNIGELDRARAALDAAGASPSDEVRGWLALYEGNLTAAREGLRTIRDQRAGSVLARAFLSRTRAERAPLAGEAFLAIARNAEVTSDAAIALERAAGELPETRSLFLAAAAREHSRVGRDVEALRIWRELSTKNEDSPEAPEATLEWARLSMATGDSAAAIEQLERLIITWPRSALVPQARRELDVVRGRNVMPVVPPAGQDAQNGSGADSAGSAGLSALSHGAPDRAFIARGRAN